MKDLSWNAEHFLEMYKSLTDPDIIAANKRTAERKKRIEDRKADVGMYVV